MFGGARSRLVALLAVLVLACGGAAQAHPVDAPGYGTAGEAENGHVRITGALDTARDRIDPAQVSVRINGTDAQTGPGGHFAAEVPLARYYRIEITGPGIFAMVQTFGNAEIADSTCACLAVPAIELVARKPGRIELFFGGDSMAGRRYFEPGRDRPPVLDRVTLDRDLDRLFAPMRPYFETSDLASINLESAVAAEQPGPPAPKRYMFFSPPELPKALARAGIDHVSLGNNHTADYRAAGMRTTIDALDAAGIAWSGAGMDQEEAERAARFEVRGEKLGIFGFVGWRGTWDPNQTATPTKAGAAWGLRTTVERVTLRERRAGFLPIMHYHGNVEYADRPSEMSLPRFRAAIEKGAPVVIGHHPHVTQGLELYRGGLIAHSLGNFLFDQEHPHTQVTYALKVWLDNGKFLRAEAIPMQVLDYRPVPAVGGMREASLRRLHWLSAELGTQLRRTGGHAAVWAKGRGVRPQACTAPREFRLATFAPACPGQDADFGRNMVPRGDFENSTFLEARDQFWQASSAAVDYRHDDAMKGYLALLPEAVDKNFYIYSNSYLRDLYATRFTLSVRVRSPRDAEVELLIKQRPDESDEPTPSIVGEPIAIQRIDAAPGWQNIRFDFTLPPERAGVARAFRPILRFRFKDAGVTGERTIEMDDFALVEWANEADRRDPAQAWRWTHMRTNSPPDPAGQ